MLRYIGGGAYIHGVPARDLTDEEEKAFAKAIAEQERLVGIKLYEKVTLVGKSDKADKEKE